jgi:mono/diheme cytochrome c family protein
MYAKISVVLFAIALGACSESQPKGFSLPPGSAEIGEMVFQDFHCHSCHTVDGIEFEALEGTIIDDREVRIHLGGEQATPQTYADLVTSIINPSHRIAEGYKVDETTDEEGRSKMAYYNGVMTVEELVDLVTFLETRYTVIEKPYTHYNPYAPL